MQTPNQFEILSAESPLKEAIQVASNEGDARPVLGHDDNPEAGQPVAPTPYTRAFPTWEAGFAFLMGIHDEISAKHNALLARRGELNA